MRFAVLGLVLSCRQAVPPPTDSAEPPLTPAEAIEVAILTEPGIRDLRLVAPEGVSIRWSENALATELDGATVPAHRLSAGATWRVDVVDAEGRTGTASHTVPSPPGGNVMVLLLDDVGVDKISAFGRPDSPQTPVLDSLAAEGMMFTRAYSPMACSPTRAALLTGRHGSRTGLGWLVEGTAGGRLFQLPLESITIPEALADARTADPWSHSAHGKWHLAGVQSEGFLTHPLDQGFDWYGGRMMNPPYAAGTGYFSWEKNLNGTTFQTDTYMTTDAVDDALLRMEQMPEPWFLYVAFNAVHTPLQPPPADLVTTVPAANAPAPALFHAVLEALETEIARLLQSMDPEVRARTTIIVAGDNGTSNFGYPDDDNTFRNKGKPYEGGIRVPLIVVSPHVTEPGSQSDAFVHVVDIFPTVADIAGVPLTGPDGQSLDLGPGAERLLDGRSLMPYLADPDRLGRETIYAEGFRPNGNPATYDIERKALRDREWKLIRQSGVDEFFHLDPANDEVDVHDLLLDPGLDAEAQAAYARLSAEMDEVAETVTWEGF